MDNSSCDSLGFLTDAVVFGVVESLADCTRDRRRRLTEVEEPKPVVMRQIRAGRVVLAKSNIDDWIFGNLKSDHDRRMWLNTLLNRELDLLLSGGSSGK